MLCRTLSGVEEQLCAKFEALAPSVSRAVGGGVGGGTPLGGVPPPEHKSGQKFYGVRWAWDPVQTTPRALKLESLHREATLGAAWSGTWLSICSPG